MCGICGIVVNDRARLPDDRVVSAAADLLRHRGPDSSGTYSSPVGRAPHAALGHRRLSIIDLEGGHQPMASPDGQVWVAFNGEIYNFRELRKELEARGCEFRTRSDTEAILHAYAIDGEACFQHLRGMFAIAIWDNREKKLLLARDRLGQKPLFYAESDGTLTFGSQPKVIFALSQMEARLCPAALDAYLAYQYVPHPLCIYQGIHKLPPAHYMVYENGRSRLARYWALDRSHREKMPEGEAIERVRAALEESVRLRLVSDVPLGAFLSGGLDSSIIVGLMAASSSRPVKTFSIGFEEEEFNESDYAHLVARRFGCEHHEFVVRPNAIEILPNLVDHFDEPFADSSAIPTYYVSQMTREHVTVALSGDGGDEVFAGYDRYTAMKLGRLVDRMAGRSARAGGAKLLQQVLSAGKARSTSQRARRFVQGLPSEPGRRYFDWIAIFNDDARRRLYTPEFLNQVSFRETFSHLDRVLPLGAEEDLADAVSFADVHTYLPGDLLVKADIASMAHSLEERAPFLDHKLVELAFSLPAEFRHHGKTGKYILRKAFGPMLPESILRRPKKGFGVPLARWFRHDLRDFVRPHLLEGTVAHSGIFSLPDLARILEEHDSGREDRSAQLWALLMLELWASRQSPGCP